jgi:hypothetical protein
MRAAVFQFLYAVTASWSSSSSSPGSSPSSSFRSPAHYVAFDLQELNSTEYEILENFYDSTGGDDWANNTNWLQSNTSLASWFGVEGTKEGKVKAISMNANSLTGTLCSFALNECIIYYHL